jgi:hypothetical protein
MVSVAVLELPLLLESPPYAACNVTLPAVTTVIVTEHSPLVRAHVVDAKNTEPVPIWDQLTVPVIPKQIRQMTQSGSTVQVMIVDEPATADLGLQERTSILVFCFVTVRLYVPADGEYLESPP